MTHHEHEHTDAQDDGLPPEERARRAAHVILDGIVALDGADTSPGGPDDEAATDAMQLAFTQLLEIGAVEMTFDDDEEELELDISALMAAMVRVVRHLVTEVARLDGTSQDDVVASVRTAMDG